MLARAVPCDAYTAGLKKYHKRARTLYYLSPKPPLGISLSRGYNGVGRVCCSPSTSRY